MQAILGFLPTLFLENKEKTREKYHTKTSEKKMAVFPPTPWFYNIQLKTALRACNIDYYGICASHKKVKVIYPVGAITQWLILERAKGT